MAIIWTLRQPLGNINIYTWYLAKPAISQKSVGVCILYHLLNRPDSKA